MNTESLFICFAIVTSSFWGSWHCAAMCGPIASVMARKNSSLYYHLGRGVSYLLIGMLGGYIGSFFLKSQFQSIRIVSALLLAGILGYMGVQVLLGNRLKFGPNFKWVHARITSKSSGLVIGLLSVFLPCGWLYSYVVAAVATQSVSTGAMVMTLFWIGGLPALSALSLVVNKSVGQAPQKQQAVAGAVLVFASLYSVVSFFFKFFI